MSFFSALLGNAAAVSREDLTRDFGGLLINGETIDIGFKLIRDTFIFTNKRLILVDIQGLTGSKVEYKSVLYSKISRFSVESNGSFDLDAELKIWISGSDLPSVRKQFNRSIDIYEVQKILANYVLNY